MALTYTFKESCERISVEWRRKLRNRLAYDPLPSSELLDELQMTVITPANAPGLSLEQRQQLASANDWSGVIIALSPITVLSNPSHLAARHESDMMHECAHIILKHPMIAFDPLKASPPRNPKYEEEAVYLGGCLQIPKRGLLWAIQKNMKVDETAHHFGASTEMVRYRANMIGQRKCIEAN